MREKIIEMLHIQEALDKSFMDYMGKESLSLEEVAIALFDECGELCHSLKANWCYWKKSEKPVDREEVKKELADVYHFALTLHRLLNGFVYDEDELDWKKADYKDINWFDVLQIVSNPDENVLYDVIYLTNELNFTFDEMYDAYMEKNKENYERMKRGY